ncbi:MAG TPA: grasp-with-spasm system ATP-grasp peptide maturase [Bacteroidia bacterium]|jgi:ATP-GRASP peptide maturase of grasp-with-spasm system|nr:grasp-with-spasm system ATP-grasp peptide maturase [Bacteroidia bacterium]HRG52583.1 grasp-with-spasm system ATP-grasp peptide maturase [Bacteroidia bacterium]
MILIISEQNDPSTNEVINWLLAMGKKFIRINAEDDLVVSDFSNTEIGGIDFVLSTRTISVRYSDVLSVWYRRGELKIKDIPAFKNELLTFYLEKEKETLQDFIEFAFQIKEKIIGNFQSTVNKLKVLHTAKNVGLKTPDTYIINSKSELNSIFKKHKSFISKSIFECCPVRDENNQYELTNKTSRIRSNLVETVPSNFFYTLIQKEIEKSFEIRAFYIHGSIYAAAMLTQDNEKTSVDYRNYDDDKPTRTIPFDLPQEIIDKLKKLMVNLDLNTGSFDLIYSNDEYIFLEVNPVGQFGMVSYPCNHYLEKLIAEKL